MNESEEQHDSPFEEAREVFIKETRVHPTNLDDSGCATVLAVWSVVFGLGGWVVWLGLENRFDWSLLLPAVVLGTVAVLVLSVVLIAQGTNVRFHRMISRAVLVWMVLASLVVWGRESCSGYRLDYSNDIVRHVEHFPHRQDDGVEALKLNLNHARTYQYSFFREFTALADVMHAERLAPATRVALVTDAIDAACQVSNSKGCHQMACQGLLVDWSGSPGVVEAFKRYRSGECTAEDVAGKDNELIDAFESECRLGPMNQPTKSSFTWARGPREIFDGNKVSDANRALFAEASLKIYCQAQGRRCCHEAVCNSKTIEKWPREDKAVWSLFERLKTQQKCSVESRAEELAEAALVRCRGEEPEAKNAADILFGPFGKLKIMMGIDVSSRSKTLKLMETGLTMVCKRDAQCCATTAREVLRTPTEGQPMDDALAPMIARSLQAAKLPGLAQLEKQLEAKRRQEAADSAP